MEAKEKKKNGRGLAILAAGRSMEIGETAVDRFLLSSSSDLFNSTGGGSRIVAYTIQAARYTADQEPLGHFQFRPTRQLAASTRIKFFSRSQKKTGDSLLTTTRSFGDYLSTTGTSITHWPLAGR